MELVYLWVEEYKNIHHQGFNFSPRFRCEFKAEYEIDADGHEKLKDNCELIIEENVDEKGKKKYIENFFGDNINVTAIVGKNGSGKSSVLDFLLDYMMHYTTKKKYIVIFKRHTKNKQLFIDTNIISNAISQEYLQIKSDYELTPGRLSNVHGSININNTFFDENILVKHKNNRIFSSLSAIDKLIINHLSYPSLILEFGDKYLFDTLTINMNYNSLDENLDIDNRANYNKILRKIESWKSKKNTNIIKLFIANNTFSFFVKWATESRQSIDLSDMYNILNKCKSIDSFIDNLSNFLENKYDISELESYYHTAFRLPQIIQSFENIKSLSNRFYVNKNNFILYIKLDKPNEIEEILSITNTLNQRDTDFVKYDFINSKNISYSDLSDGERQIIAICNNLISSLDSLKNTKAILVLDEFDIYMHPFWSKEIFYLINKIINKFIKKYNKTELHFIFTTHSPFLLSDIPKQNIIFLDTYKENDEEVKKGNQKVGNCKVLKHDEVMAKKETFGANIHTLLSDSFFMADGLMGEFAKGKINNVIAYLRSSENMKDMLDVSESWMQDKNKLLLFIKTIGEPFLRNKILELYYEKYDDEQTRETRRRELVAEKGWIERELSFYD